MLKKDSKAAHGRGLRPTVVKLGLFALLLTALAAPALLFGTRSAGAHLRAASVGRAAQSTPQDDAAGRPVSAERIRPVSVTRVNFKQLSDAAKRAARVPATSAPATSVQTMRAAPPPLTIEEMPAPGGTAAPAPADDSDEAVGPGPVTQDEVGGPLVPSPTPTQNFLAQEDGPKIGTTSFTIPPDTMGAVGLDKVFTQTNSNFRIHDKATGAPLSTVNSDTFWAPAGGSGVFDPRVVYDPYNNRWITTIVSNASSPQSSVLIGVSATSDPQGTYYLYRYIVGCAAGGTSPVTGAACNAGGEWADFPMLGFNKHWVTVSWNQFTSNTNAFVAGGVLAFDYPQLRTGPATPNAFRLFTSGSVSGAFCTHPATTLDANEANVYFVGHISSGGATYRTFTLAGAPPSIGGPAGGPTLTPNAIQTRPGGGWTQPGGDILPQTCVGTSGVTCPATLRRIDSGDAFVRSNVVYRNGRLYYPQTVGLPAGGLTRTAAQWTVINPTGTFVDGGRVDDPTATATNGGRWYAYPSIAVNKNGDILMGFSEFESDDFADAGYSFRLGTDAAGTMRDPVIYKEGEDYYSKTFGGTRNRWGDYSHAVVDPSNDRDLWTVQEYAGTRIEPNANTTTNNSRWGTWWAKVTAPVSAGELIISEFRLRGPGLPAPNTTQTDEFIEIYNASGAPLTVATTDGSAGFAIAASDGVIRCTIPNGTTIPNRGHFLCVNSAGYSLAAYPAGNGTTATGDATYTADIPDNAGIAIFNTANVANFSLATRLDAVGSSSEANTLYREGEGYPPITSFNIDHSFYRSYCPNNRPVVGFGSALGCTPNTGGLPRDSNDNFFDFVFVDTSGTNAGAGQRLGAPGPENLSSPIQRNAQMPGFYLDGTVGGSQPPNRVRDLTSDPANNSTFGTLDIRRRIVNNTGAPVTRLRFRVTDLTTFPADSGFADLRVRTSTPMVVSGINDPATCSPAATPCTVTVQGTTLEQPPTQPNGGAFNSSLSANTVTLAQPLAPGQSINVRFLLGIQQTGLFRFFVNVEVLP